jgi:hypothetical protein
LKKKYNKAFEEETTGWRFTGIEKKIKQELNDFHRESKEVHRGYKRYKSNNNSQKCATWSLFQGPLFLWCCGFWSKKNCALQANSFK